jgi:hypothetical protein
MKPALVCRLLAGLGAYALVTGNTLARLAGAVPLLLAVVPAAYWPRRRLASGS